MNIFLETKAVVNVSLEGLHKVSERLYFGGPKFCPWYCSWSKKATDCIKSSKYKKHENDYIGELNYKNIRVSPKYIDQNK